MAERNGTNAIESHGKGYIACCAICLAIFVFCVIGE
jgi:hypothetical protein